MFKVSIEDVKKLRQETFVSITECKKSLEEAEGDFSKARRILKEKGLADARARSSRTTSEGSIFTLVTQDGASILEIGCETGFVAKTDQFRSLGRNLAQTLITKQISEITEDLIVPLKEVVAVLKENIILKRFKVFAPLSSNVLVSQYIHNEGEIGVLVKASVICNDSSSLESIQSLFFDCAIHCAAKAPLYLQESNIPREYLSDQLDIFSKKVDTDEKTAGKPNNIRHKIAEGMLSKYINEICFLRQNFVKEPSLTVGEKIQTFEKNNNCKIKIDNFVYFKVGEEKVD